MSERSISAEEKKDLIRTFEIVLNDFEVVAKSDVEVLVEERVADLKKADEATIEDPEVAEEEAHTYGPDDLQQLLPDDVWEVVRGYLAQAPDVAKSWDTEAAINAARTSARIHKVGPQRSLPQGNAQPSHEPEEVTKGGSPTNAILERFYSEPSTATVTKSKESKNTPAGLMAIEEADL